jgi:hypothetical protein
MSAEGDRRLQQPEPILERKPYCVPQLGRVSLEADQVLGVGCKAQSTVARTGVLPLGGHCGISPCSSWGS